MSKVDFFLSPKGLSTLKGDVQSQFRFWAVYLKYPQDVVHHSYFCLS